MSKTPFVQDLDLVWRSLGYASKRNAVRRLTSTFQDGIDYLILRGDKIADNGKTVKCQRVMLTPPCYFRLRDLAPNGSQVKGVVEEVGRKSRQLYRNNVKSVELF